jgi:hypothetical protein
VLATPRNGKRCHFGGFSNLSPKDKVSKYLEGHCASNRGDQPDGGALGDPSKKILPTLRDWHAAKPNALALLYSSRGGIGTTVLETARNCMIFFLKTMLDLTLSKRRSRFYRIALGRAVIDGEIENGIAFCLKKPSLYGTTKPAIEREDQEGTETRRIHPSTHP